LNREALKIANRSGQQTNKKERVALSTSSKKTGTKKGRILRDI
jgi:hypothetical protein